MKVNTSGSRSSFSRSHPATDVRIGRALIAVMILSGIGIFAIAGPAVASPQMLSASHEVMTAPQRESVLLVRLPAEQPSEPAPSSEPAPGPSETVAPTPDPGPSEENGTPTPTPEPTPEGEVPPVEDTPTDDVPQQRPATPPNVAVTQISWPSILFAAATLLLCGIAITVLSRRGRRVVVAESEVSAYEVAKIDDGTAVSSAQTLAAMISTGEAMMAGGYPVDGVRDALSDIARVNGEASAEIVTFPTAVLVSLRTGAAVETETVSIGRESLLLFQLEELDTAVQEARRGTLPPDELLTRMRVIRRLVPPFSFVQRLIASVAISTGLAMLLDASLAGVMLAGALGGLVGALMLLGSRIDSRYQALLVVAAAFVVGLVVFLVVRTNLDPGILPSLVAPLVMLLPGALLTTGVMELSTGEIMAGAARLAAGAMRLVLLAFGIVAAAALVGVPSIQLDSASQPLGPLAPWIGVAVFGLGLVVYQCAWPRSLPWILLVLYVAYAAQVIGGVFLGAVLSASIGALVMTPVAVLISRQPTGPPAIVSFLPAFLILVPGALGLAGVTSILDGDASGLTTLTTTLATMVSITLGLLVGLGLSSLLTRSSVREGASAVDQLAE